MKYRGQLKLQVDTVLLFVKGVHTFAKNQAVDGHAGRQAEAAFEVLRWISNFFLAHRTSEPSPFVRCVSRQTLMDVAVHDNILHSLDASNSLLLELPSAFVALEFCRRVVCEVCN